MKKTTILFLFSFLTLFHSTNSDAQSNSRTKKTGIVIKKNGSKINGNVKNFYTSPTFERVDPLIRFKALFSRDITNFFWNGRGGTIDDIKVKPNGAKKFEKIPVEELEQVIISQTTKKGGTRTTEFVALSGENFYGKKKKKVETFLVPSLTKGKVINTYGTIYPVRKLLSFHLFLFELGTPDAVANLMIENKQKNLSLGKGYIEEEKTYSTKKAERRSKRKNNKNFNTVYELFGDCPETKELIDKFYIARIEDKSERKKAAIQYNKTLIKNTKNFKKIIRKDRKKATADLYLELYEFDLLEIIRTYEKNCLAIDEFDPRHEMYKKEFDIINRDKNDTL